MQSPAACRGLRGCWPLQFYLAEYTGVEDTRRHVGPAGANAAIPKLPEGKKVGAEAHSGTPVLY